MFGTSFDTSADKFQNYYKDLSMRVKNREVDLLIVVNMFLTGFDAQSVCLDLYEKYRPGRKEKEDITDDIDYILMLVEKYHDGNCEDKEILSSIRKAVDASMQLRSKKELIEAFISQVNVDTQVTADWRRFVLKQGIIEKLKVFFEKYFGLGIAELKAGEQEQAANRKKLASFFMSVYKKRASDTFFVFAHR